jgi:hypothetical protein
MFRTEYVEAGRRVERHITASQLKIKRSGPFWRMPQTLPVTLHDGYAVVVNNTTFRRQEPVEEVRYYVDFN